MPGLVYLGLLIVALVAFPALAAENAAEAAAAAPVAAPPAADTRDQLRQELELLKKQVRAPEERLTAEKPGAAEPAGQPPAAVAAQIRELDDRVSQTERSQALDRISFTGDYHFEAHTIQGRVPAHYDGMALQNLVVKTMFSMPILGRPPASVSEVNNTVSGHYADYLQFTNNLTFANLQKGMASFPAAMQQQLFGMLMPSTFSRADKANTNDLFTNRLRLRLEAKIADNISFTGRLSMYKVFDDSTCVQVFNGQPSTLHIDGTTAGVPNSDQCASSGPTSVGTRSAAPNSIFRSAAALPPMVHRSTSGRMNRAAGLLRAP